MKQHVVTPYRRGALAAFVAATLTLLAAGCGLSSSESGDKTLTVATWKGYGADLAWVQDEFEKETGASIRYVYIDSLATLVEQLRKNGDEIDVALPNLQYLRPAVEDGLLEPLDVDRIEHYEEVVPTLASRKELRVDGELYGLPWTWGSSALFYVDGAFDTPPTSYDVLWDPSMKGKIALVDDPTVLVPIAALHVGEDPNDPDMSKVEPALKELKANAKLITTSAESLASALTSSDVVAGINASSVIGGMANSGFDGLRYVIPSEGGVGWLDNWAISANSQNTDLAYEWLNYMSSADFQTRWANNAANQSPAPANAVAVDALTSEAVERIQPQPESIERLILQVPLPADRLQGWLDSWTRVKAG